MTGSGCREGLRKASQSTQEMGVCQWEDFSSKVRRKETVCSNSLEISVHVLSELMSLLSEKKKTMPAKLGQWMEDPLQAIMNIIFKMLICFSHNSVVNLTRMMQNYSVLV